MARYDDLDEMRVVDKNGEEIVDDIHERPKKEKKPADKPQNGPKKSAYMQQKEAQQRAERVKVIVVAVAVFAAVLALLITVGILMYLRANPDGAVTKARPAEGMTQYLNEENIPALSSEGVKGLLKQAYYTVGGDLAVTLNLSNGTDKDHQVTKIKIRIFNGEDETVAQHTIEKFSPKCTVAANGYDEVYFVIDKRHVKIHDDPLSMLGTTLEITSLPLRSGNESDGNGPKDVAPGRTYFENVGNMPELSADGVKATVIRARYTNDGSLAVTLSLSNGSEVDKRVSAADVTIKNGNTQETIAAYRFDPLEKSYTIAAMSYGEIDLIIDAPYVPLQDDSLASLSCTVSVSASEVQ